MTDQASLNQLLQWSINNSSNPASQTNGTTTSTSSTTSSDPSRGLNAAALAELLGGPSDADRMRAAMTAILSPQLTVIDKETAWDNFEQLIENLDNANNMPSLGLWEPLLSQLEDAEPENRRMAAWCVGTAVQNNVKSQEVLLAKGGVGKLVGLVTGDKSAAVRKKAVSALSSEVRNFQPGLDELVHLLPEELGGGAGAGAGAGAVGRGVDAGDMEAVDVIMQRLRAHTAGAS